MCFRISGRGSDGWRRAVLAAVVLLGAAGCDDGGSSAGTDDAGGADASGRVDAGPTEDARVDVDRGPEDADAAVDDGGEPGDGTPQDGGTSDGATGDAEVPQGEPGCENLAPGHCLLPFPSDFFSIEDANGRRLEFGDDALPVNVRGERMSPVTMRAFDGFGLASPALFILPGATTAGGPRVFHPADSLEPDSKTILLDTETGERVPHWLEVDYLSRRLEHPILVIRPAVPLRFTTRYVVAVRGLVDADGAVVPAPPGFAALRDGTPSSWHGVEPRRARFDAEVFAPLVTAGVTRESLQLAWDFTTGSSATLGDLLPTVRDRFLEHLDPLGPEYTIEEVRENPHPEIRYRIAGIARIPSVLEPATASGLRRLKRDANGAIRIEGFEEVPFTIQIPHSAYSEAPLPAPAMQRASVMQYGHGFLGRHAEADNGWLREFAGRHNFLILATDMYGMAQVDTGVWLNNLNRDASSFPLFTEKVFQGLMNHLALVRMVKNRFINDPDPRFQRADQAPLYDTGRFHYFGNSQGGTMGTVLMSLTRDIPRGVLGVPGCAYPFLVHRSTVFDNFVRMLAQVFNGPGDVSVVLGLLGTGWSMLDPLTHVERVLDGHDVMLHVAKEDSQVHNENSFLLARALGARHMIPAVRPVWGLETQAYPTTGTTMVEYDFGVPDQVDPELPPPPETDTHGLLRRVPAAQDQMMHFLETGEVRNYCDGACDPE